MDQKDGRKRVVIEAVTPEIDGGRFPIKRVVGEHVTVEADIFTDGQDVLSAFVLYRGEEETRWRGREMTHLGNDRWRGDFTVSEQRPYRYTLQAWVDPFCTWVQNLVKKVAAEQDVVLELVLGADLISEAARRAAGIDRSKLEQCAAFLSGAAKPSQKATLAASTQLSDLMRKYPDRRFATTYGKQLAVWVDRSLALFGSWYELFPRSCAPVADRHGTFRDCSERLPYIAAMGFDVLYLPPIHPIGRTHRKGKNNHPRAGPEDPGSPWAIGSSEGGHRAVHPRLGSLEDFRNLLGRAGELGLEVAIDLAFQCSPDHPYVQEHPGWFRWRPDQTIQYAENPPKKYEDIYPLNFEGEPWQELWSELRDVIRFWIDQGVRIFRVDNPHTKPFSFWEWVIGEIRREYPDTIFLAEAFTRPKVMYRLAKLGFSQSYTYFAWRNTKWELTEYFTELTRTGVGDYFRPNLWPNTPDILTEYLQTGGRPAFMARLVLAATLGASYGIYGPAFELMAHEPREWGSEEYLDSEKYEIKQWDLDRPDSLADFIALVNRVRKENPALHRNRTLAFHPIDNDQLICFSKHTEDLSNIVVVVVNLDPHHTHAGWLELPLARLGVDRHTSYQVHDLLGGGRFLWHGARNYVALDPSAAPAHIFLIRRKVRTERDFDYFI